MQRLWSISLLSLLAAPAFAGDATCFRSAAEAATGAGVEDSHGFYLVETRLDPLTLMPWAAVAHCGRPDLPITLVRTGSAVKSPVLKASLESSVPAVQRPVTLILAALNSGAAPEPKVLHVRVNRLRTREVAVREGLPAALPDVPVVRQAAAQTQSTPLIVAGKPVLVLWEAGSARGELTGVAMANGALGQSVKVRMAGLIAGAQERIVSGTVQADGTLTLEAGR